MNVLSRCTMLLIAVCLLLSACGRADRSPADQQIAAAPTITAVSATVTPISSPTSTAAPAIATPPAVTSVPPATRVPPTSTATPFPSPTPAPPTATAIPPSRVPPAASAAPPTATPVRAAANQDAAIPVRLQIPDIGLDYRPVPVGLDKNRVPIVLDHDVAWYRLSARPGQRDNVVFWAHVLRFRATPKTPAPFERIAQLQPGALIIVTRADGTQFRYRVTKLVRVTPSDVQYILPTGREQVTLVSCIGDKVIENGTLTKTERLITIAEPAD